MKFAYMQHIPLGLPTFVRTVTASAIARANAQPARRPFYLRSPMFLIANRRGNRLWPIHTIPIGGHFWFPGGREQSVRERPSPRRSRSRQVRALMRSGEWCSATSMKGSSAWAKARQAKRVRVFPRRFPRSQTFLSITTQLRSAAPTNSSPVQETTDRFERVPPTG